MNDNKFSGIKVLAIILLIIVVLAVMYYATIDGIVGVIKTFFNNLARSCSRRSRNSMG